MNGAKVSGLICKASPTLLAAFALTCSSDSPTDLNNDDDGRVLRVDRLDIPAGETREYSSDFEIIAANGMDIAGDIVINPDREGDFKLTCETGTLRISGSVTVDNSEQFAAGTSLNKPSDTSALNQARIGISLDFSIIQEGGLIDLTDLEQIGAGNASHEPGAVLGSGGGTIVGDAGVDGGSIELRAPGGEIRLPDELSPLEASNIFFVLGIGGEGQSIVVDRQQYTTTDTRLELIGGRGGDGGNLILEADIITGIPPLNEIGDDYFPIIGGHGGSGGGVFWDNKEISIIDPNGGAVDRTFPLQEIVFRGGDGGNSQTSPGEGGYAVYWGGRTIHERGNPTPSVSVTGGNGGDIVYAPIPQAHVAAGNGGEVAALGNNGRDGDDSNSPHGTDGGDVFGHGGDGGSVRNGVQALVAEGGHAGLSADSAALFPGILVGGNSANSMGFDDEHFGLVSGRGGAGADRCNGCPGGDAGASGAVSAYGGDGGDAPVQAGMTSTGGNGGNIWTATAAGGADGGNGNPAGRANCAANIQIVPGSGGQGNSAGQDGVERVSNDIEPCGSDGIECVGDGECEGDDDPLIASPCWQTHGATFTALYTTVQKCTDAEGNSSTATRTWEEKGVYDCMPEPPLTGCRWVVSGVDIVNDGTPTNYFSSSYNPFRTSAVLTAVDLTIAPFCRGDNLFYPGSPHEITTISPGCTTTLTYSFRGCNPRVGPTKREGWMCCEHAPDVWQARYRPFDTECPTQ